MGISFPCLVAKILTRAGLILTLDCYWPLICSGNPTSLLENGCFQCGLSSLQIVQNTDTYTHTIYGQWQSKNCIRKMILASEMLAVNFMPWRRSEEGFGVLVEGITLWIFDQFLLIHTLYFVSFCFLRLRSRPEAGGGYWDSFSDRNWFFVRFCCWWWWWLVFFFWFFGGFYFLF